MFDVVSQTIVYSYFMPVWPRGALGSSMHYCPRPKGRGRWCIELSTVPRGSSFVYSAKQPWNNCFITQPALKIPAFSLRNASFIGTRRRYTQITSWRSTSFSWCLMSSTRQETKLLTAAFSLRLNGWRHKRGIVDSMDRLVTPYERRYMYVAVARAN